MVHGPRVSAVSCSTPPACAARGFRSVRFICGRKAPTAIRAHVSADLVAAIFAKPPPGDSTAFWAALRNAFPDAMTDKAQLEGAVSNTSFIYAAGYETTANAVSHTLAALAIDQDSQTALAEELHDAGLLATPERPDPPAVTAEQLSKLSVLDAVCHEALRVFPPAPNGGFRELTHDTEVRCGRGSRGRYPCIHYPCTDLLCTIRLRFHVGRCAGVLLNTGVQTVTERHGALIGAWGFVRDEPVPQGVMMLR